MRVLRKIRQNGDDAYDLRHPIDRKSASLN